MATLPRASTDLSKQLNYDKFLTLFTSEHTKDMHERQVSVLQRVCRHNANGFAIADLPSLVKLLALALEKVQQDHEEFVGPILTIIDLCALPFISRKANEKITSRDDVQQMLNLLGSLLLHPDTTVQMHAVATLTKYAQGYGCDDVDSTTTLLDMSEFQPDIKAPSCPHDLRLPTRNWNQLQLNESQCTEHAIRSLLRETDELIAFDTDQDGQLSREELHRYKVMNDAVQTNDDEEYDAAAEARREAAADAPGSSANVETPPPHFLVENLHFLLQLSYSAINALEIIQSPVPSKLVHLLYSVQNFREPFILKIVEILNNLLDHTEEQLRTSGTASTLAELLDKHRTSNALFILGKHDNLMVLKTILERLMEGGYRQTDKELRNDILVACCKIAGRHSNHKHFVSSGFMDFLLLYSTAAETNAKIPGNVRVFGSAQEVDFECKRLLWHLTALLLGGPQEACKSAVAESNLCDTLLAYLDLGKPDTQQARSLKYSRPQTQMLMEDALSMLFTILPAKPEKFTESNGHKIVLNYVQGVLDDAEGGKDSARLDVLRSLALRLLWPAARVPSGQSRLVEEGALPYLLDFFHDHSNSLEDRTNALRCIGDICVDNEENQTIFRRAKGIQRLVEELRQATPDVEGTQAYVAGIIDCLWDVAVGNKRSEARLLVIDGVDALLDLLDCCPRLLRNNLIGCLADLARNPKALHYFRIWRSDRSLRSLTSMLFTFYVEEERRLHVPTGIVHSMERPLEPVKRPARVGTPDAKVGKRLRSALAASKSVGASEADPAEEHREAVLAEDLRSKVYSLLLALGFDGTSSEGDEADGDGETSTAATSSVDEQIFLRGIREYAEFRKAASWADVKEELTRQGIMSIFPDFVYMESRLEHGFNLAMAAKSDQRALKEIEADDEARQEAKFHDGIKHRYEQAKRTAEIKQKAKANKRKAMFSS